MLACVAGMALLGGAGPAAAHPVGNFTINLYSGIHVQPEAVRIDYVVEMAEISTQEQKPSIDVDSDGEITAEEREGWAQRVMASAVTNLTMTANGQPVPLRVTDSTMRFRPGQGGLDLIYLQATIEGRVPTSGELVYTDANFTERPGWREITAVADPGVVLTASSVPETTISDALLAYPPERTQDPLNVRDARISFQPSDAPVEPTAAPTPGSGSSGGSASPAGSGGFADLLATSANRAIGLLLLIAFGFGFVHAIGPGHGKTIMAASTLSGSMRLRHALAMGGAVAAMHCATVVGLGLIAYAASQTFSSDRVFNGLRLLTALVVLVVGAVMLVVRWRERRHAAAHATPGAGGGHGHAHGRGHRHPHAEPDPDARGLDKAGLAAVAASGGLIPSPSAVIVLLGAIAVDRIPLGISLVVAFSVGLAASLVLVGTVSHYAKTWIGRTESRIGAWLPLAAAAAIFVVGIVLTIQAADAVRAF
jgi:ABC-type nickel/cobalt efflux system permease component RcnA